jgi:hypothetical protein
MEAENRMISSCSFHTDAQSSNLHPSIWGRAYIVSLFKRQGVLARVLVADPCGEQRIDVRNTPMRNE